MERTGAGNQAKTTAAIDEIHCGDYVEKGFGITEAVTLKGELAHRASLISISLSGQPSLCDNAVKGVLRKNGSY